jgi:NarL family two-component system response regulator LiaR
MPWVRYITLLLLWWMLGPLAAGVDESREGPKRVLIVDDQPLFRVALEQLVARQPDFEVVATAQDGQQAVECCRASRPDAVLMEVGVPGGMPGMDGLQTIRTIKQEHPHTVILLLTARQEESTLADTLKAGASGYILKTSSGEQILDALRKALEGATPLDPELATGLLLRLMGNDQEGLSTTAQQDASLVSSLSPRELEVLHLVARGYTNHSIAKSLFVSVSTVKKHLCSITSKLEVSDRTQAAIKALDLGLLRSQNKEE